MSAKIHSGRPRPAARSSATVIATLVCLATLPAAEVDDQINREVWKQKYGVLDSQMAELGPYAGWLDQDADGDGVANRSEFIAGTNPFKKLPGEARFQPPAVSPNSSTLSLTFPTVPGKLYGAESSDTLVDAWSRGTLPTLTGDGSVRTLVVPKDAGKFFKLTVTDQATQGDEVSDWAKFVLGLSMNSPLSSQSSFNHATLAASLQSQNAVTLTAIDLAGTQPPDAVTTAGDFALTRVSRSGYMLPGEVTVPIVKSGTAVEGSDYAPLPASVTFPAGVYSLDLKITPLFNPARTSSATVFLTAGAPGSAGASGTYVLGGPASAGVTVYPSGNPTGTGLTAQYFRGANSTYNHAANFGGAAATYTFVKANATTGTATINYTGSPSVPFAPLAPVVLQFTSGNLSTSFNAPLSYQIATLPTANSFTVTVTGAVPSSTTVGSTNNMTVGGFTAPVTARVPTLDVNWGTGSPDPAIPADNFSVRWTGQVLPQYSQTYYFLARVDDGMQLWVNGQSIVSRWPGGSPSDRTGSIQLQAGVPYDIRMDYYEAGSGAEAHLSWYSDDQAKQIIPTGRLFPTLSGNAPLAGDPPAGMPAVTSPTHPVHILGSGSPFTLPLTGSNGGTFSSGDLPPWLSLVNGVLTGTPPGPGIYQFTVTTTNAAGSGSVVITLEVLAAAGQLTRDLWTSGVTGAGLAHVPWTTPPTATDTAALAEDAVTTYGENTGERLRGYFIAPVTGNYYFWIAASNAGELWISNDSEPVNKVLRARVTDSPAGTWNAQPGQKSRWLSLVAGKKYYLEALHNTGASAAGNHLSVAWFLDPTGNTANPLATGCPPAAATVGGVIPAHAISPWDNPPTTTIPGTLHVTNLQGVPGLGNITGTGGAFLRVNGSSAVLQLNHSGLTSGSVSKKILNAADQVVFDIGAQDKNYPALKTSDGGYTWNLQPADMTALNNGQLRIVIATVNHPDGELSGTFGKTAGSQTAPAVPAYPAWTDLHASSDAANSRFLTQATFGPSPADMATVKTGGYRPWIESQFTAPITRNVPYILENLSPDPQNPYGSALMFNSWWKNSITAPDQLRQRAAFALSEILVVSDTGPLNGNGRVLADYYDTLLEYGFGNFRDILKQVTLSPAMGVYLDMRGNTLGDIKTGLHPNENYAREILQLFSAGLYRTWPDGTLVLNSKGNPVPTYDQSVITGMARVFTGWTWGQALQGSGRLPTGFNPAANYLDPMVLVPAKHEFGSKILLDNVILPPATNTDPATALVDAASITIQTTHPVNGPGNLVTTAITNQYDLNGLKDLEATLDNIMANSAVGPYICRQLIQRLVTSHPKPEYVHRVVRAFNGERNVDNVATGIRGDMKEVFRAILLDYEARDTTAMADPKFGKQREPLLRVTGPARAFPTADFPSSTYSQSGLGTILVTTPSAHRLISGDNVRLSSFVDAGASSAQLPTTQTYPISNVTPTSFTVANNATVSLNYTVAGNIATIDAAGVAEGDSVYLKFATGGLAGGTYDGVYPVGPPSAAKFTVSLASTPADTTGGSCLVPKIVSGYNVVSSQSIAIQTTGNHNLAVGDTVQLKFVTLNTPLPAANGVYAVTSVSGPNSFKVTPPVAISTGSQGGNSVTVFPLKGSQWTRNGTVTVEPSTWGIGIQGNLNQSPLNSTTVFNFFYPDYQYPGPMAQAGMTTPEFQLTNDSNTMNLTNIITQGTLTNNNGNQNGYITFFGSNAITLDLAPYMTATQTADANIPALVDALAVLLTGDNLSAPARTAISGYVASTASYPYTTPVPTAVQMRDRVRAIVHLIVTSAEYAIQK